MKRSSCLLGAAAVASALLCSTQTFAQYSLSTYGEPTNGLTYGLQDWANAVKEETNGEVVFEIYFGGALLPARNGLQGVGQGVAQAGQTVATYHPSETPLWSALSDIAFKVPEPLAVAFAATEYAFFDEQGKGEWLDNNVISLAGFGTAAYSLLCTDENLSTLADFKGKRIRTAGGPWARFVSSIGAVDVNLPSSEIYTALERGAADCANADPSHIIMGSTVKDLLKSVVLLDIGLFFPGSTMMINVDTWNEISPENRRVILNETAKNFVDRQLFGYIEAAERGLVEARADGIGIYEPAADLQAAYDAFLETMDQDIIVAAEAAGVVGVEQEIADFTALLQKWQGLLKNVDNTDPVALTALVRSEIYDKVDVETITQR
jgi:TRAP-type C4-dicarboxylate transport system substrate-binding protein